ncbi:ABC transporter permease [Lysinibacter sp. HNR]|uniref:ABC transporter permease n=1 Tax=Lysinibacter sp. HNR TaxID=3031408 RepID=UPI002435466A|nr:ABC transporter permease [Lysinibacter sp. HNR]WGD38357.1 ABC transporter permease [Lysinibacter sp. HNR]
MQNNKTADNTHFVAPFSEDTTVVVDRISVQEKARSTWSDAWRQVRKRPMFWISALLIIAVIVVALFPFWFTNVAPNHGCDLSNSNAGPRAGHIFGFNMQGCDVYSRVIYGAQSSLTVGLVATALVTIFGGLMGALAGFYGGFFDAILSRLGDIFFAIPTVLGAIVVMQMFAGARTPLTVALVLAMFAWPQIARIMRGSVLSTKGSDFVMASTALGVSRFRILIRHVIPNAIAPVIVVATISLGTFIVAEATLSFLGIGLPPDVMSWGNDIAAAQQSIRTAPMTLFYPAAALSLTVLSFLMLGDVVRDALDPKARKR